MAHCLIISLILSVGYLTPVFAVTDAEIEALEKQIEQQEREEKRKVEAKRKKEKYTLLIEEAEQAIRNKDKELAISKYNGALELKQSDRIAIDGIKEAKKLNDKVCYDVFGNWESKLGKVNVNEDGTFTWDNRVASGSGTWECSDPKVRKFDFITPSAWISDWTSILTEDGRCFSFWNEACWTRPDY